MEGIKLSFSAPKGAQKARPSVNVHAEEASTVKEHISEFTGEQVVEPPKKVRVIAALPDANKAALRAKNAKKDDVGELSDKFEAAIQPEVKQTTYGLVLSAPQSAPAPAAKKARPEQAAKTEFQADVDGLPDAPQADAYQSMPVEDFGKALLLGMGYTKETDVAPIEYIARPSRMGLGVKPGDIATGKRSYKQMVDEAGNIKSVVRGGDKLIDTATLGPREGKAMLVAAGRHKGLRCVVRKVDVDGAAGRVLVRLLPSEQDVMVSADVLSEPGAPAALQSDAKPSRSDRIQPSKSDRSQPNESSRSTPNKSDKGPPSRSQAAPQPDRPSGASAAQRNGGSSRSGGGAGAGGSGRRERSRTWLTEHIRVRVVDKVVANGKLYLKKGVIICMRPGQTCDVRMDDGGRVQEGLEEGQLETVVPKAPGAAVAVLRGEHAGRHARLLEKRAEHVAVRLTETMEIATASLDDVAEYVGDMEGEDY